MVSFTSAFVRKVRRASGTVWQGVLKYKSEDGRSHQKAMTFDAEIVRTESQAWKALMEWRAELEEKSSVPEGASQLAPDYVSEYIRHKSGLADTTSDSYRYTLKHVKHPALMKPLCELEPKDVQTWLYSMEDEGKSESVRDRAFRLLNSACRNAVRMREITFNPCDSITKSNGRPRPSKADPNPLDSDGIKRLNALLDIQGHTQFADACRIALLTGMRQGEVCGLKWREIPGWKSSDYSTLTVRNVISRSSKGQHDKGMPKNNTPRRIAISPELAAVLDAQRVRQAAECIAAGIPLDGERYVLGVPGNRGEGFYSAGYLGKLWRAFAESNAIMGVKGRRATFHDLRHTFATHALASGVDVVTVAAILGHKDKAVTLNVYAEFLPDKTAEAMKQMGQAMSEAAEPATVYPFAVGFSTAR